MDLKQKMDINSSTKIQLYTTKYRLHVENSIVYTNVYNRTKLYTNTSAKLKVTK